MATIPQLLTVANKYLFFDGSVKTAVAIALAESNGDETRVSPTNSNGTIDVGAWQINSVHKRDHPTWTTEWLKNLDNNAKAMATISSGGLNWTPWTAYKNGRYKQYLDDVQSEIDKYTGGGAITDAIDSIFDSAGNAVDAVGGALDAFTNFGEWFTQPENLQRLAQIIAGIGLGLIAAAIIGGSLYGELRN